MSDTHTTTNTTTTTPRSRRAPAAPGAAMYSVDEVARLLGVARRTVYDAARRGEIPSVVVGSRRLFPRRAIDAWLAGAAPARK